MSYELAVIVSFVFTSLALGYLAFNLDKQHTPLKLLLIFAALYIMMTGVLATGSIFEQVNVTDEAVNSTIDTMYGIMMWIFRLSIAYVVVAFMISVVKTFNEIKLSKKEERYGR